MGKIRTLNEIQLKKENLQYKLHDAEKRLLNHSQSFVFSVGNTFITPVLEKGLEKILDYFLKGRKKKTTDEEE